MSWSALGMAAAVAGLALIVASALWIAIRSLALRRRVGLLTSRRPFQALEALPAQFERINDAIERLGPLGARLDAVGQDLLAASKAGARFAVDIGLVASATEDLLGALIPSMRGSMS